MNLSEERAIIEDGELKVLYGDTWRSVRLDNYDRIEIISNGANAVTVSGYHKRTGRKDCIKIYTPNKRAGRRDVSIEQYLKEVRKLAALNNPNIVTVYDAYDIDDIHVVTMEYIEGITLKKWLNDINKTCDDEVAFQEKVLIIKRVLETVVFYQEKGIIHGDLHLNNIIIDDNNDIHIIDFGTSHFTNHIISSEREVYFVWKLVRQVVGEVFTDSFFTIKCPKNAHNRISKCDARNKPPVLITKTMIAYVNTLDLYLQLPSENIEPCDVAKICISITDGIYIDFDYAIRNILINTKKTLDINSVAQIIYENIEDHIVPENIEYMPELLASINEDLLESYYLLFLLSKERCNAEEIKDRTFSYNVNVYEEDEYDSCLETLLRSSEDSFYDFMGGTSYSESECGYYKQIMYDALSICMGELLFAQEVWGIVSERRWKRKQEYLYI